MNGNISVELLHWIVEHSTSCLIHLICLSLLPMSLDLTFVIFLHLFLDVQDQCTVLLNGLISLRYLTKTHAICKFLPLQNLLLLNTLALVYFLLHSLCRVY
jgi:hypothetical protein